MLLVYNDILDRIENYKKYQNEYKIAKPIIEGFKKENLQGASYDLTINNRFMRSKYSYESVNLNNEFDVKDMFYEIVINNGDIFRIKPYEYVIVGIRERINMPDTFAASIRARVSLNRVGLIIGTQHINPSFSGVLQIGIKNETSYSIDIPADIKICQIIFESLSGEIDNEHLYRNKVNSVYFNGGDGFIPSKIYDESIRQGAEELYNKIRNRN